MYILLYMETYWDVVVFQSSMIELEKGVGPACHVYICVLLYMKLIEV